MQVSTAVPLHWGQWVGPAPHSVQSCVLLFLSCVGEEERCMCEEERYMCEGGGEVHVWGRRTGAWVKE